MDDVEIQPALVRIHHILDARGGAKILRVLTVHGEKWYPTVRGHDGGRKQSWDVQGSELIRSLGVIREAVVDADDEDGRLAIWHVVRKIAALERAR